MNAHLKHSSGALFLRWSEMYSGDAERGERLMAR